MGSSLGVAEESDFPSYAQESHLKNYLLGYKGVLEGNIDQDIKDQYWKALCEGKMGGNTMPYIMKAVYYEIEADLGRDSFQVDRIFLI